MKPLSMDQLVSFALKLEKETRFVISKIAPEIRSRFVKPVRQAELGDLKVIGIDGGLARRRYALFDVLLLRSVGVEFIFENRKLAHVVYHPSKYVEPVAIPNNRIEEEAEYQSSLYRDLDEKRMALELASRMPDLIICHGSLIPHNFQRIEATKMDVFKELAEVISSLFRLKDVMVCGVVEDSRGRVLCETVENELGFEIPAGMNDAYLLSCILEQGERTKCIDYLRDPGLRSVFQSCNIDIDALKVFYLKAGKLDLPLRIELISGETNAEKLADRLAGILLSLSTSASYSMPSVLIEADMRARIREEEADRFFGKFDMLVRKQRRNARPL